MLLFKILIALISSPLATAASERAQGLRALLLLQHSCGRARCERPARGRVGTQHQPCRCPASPWAPSIPVALLWHTLVAQPVAQPVAQQWDGAGATAELSTSPPGRGRTRTEMDEEERSRCYHGLTDAST